MLFAVGSVGADRPRQLRLGLITPPPHLWTQSARAFGQDLEAHSVESRWLNQITLEVFPSGQLGNEAQMLQLLQTGALDFGFFTTSELANRNADFAAFYVPYLARDAEHAAAVLETKTAADILSGVEKFGLIGLGYGMAGMRQVVSRKHVESLADLRGQKIRVVPDRPLTDFWYFAGAAPTPIPLSVLYDAFANGQIDAMHIDFENTLRLKLYDHAATVIHSDHMMFPMVALASAKTWATFTPEQQTGIRKLLSTHLRHLRNSYVEADKKFKQELRTQGVTLLTANSNFFQAATQPWLNKWRRLSRYVDALSQESQALMAVGNQ